MGKYPDIEVPRETLVRGLKFDKEARKAVTAYALIINKMEEGSYKKEPCNFIFFNQLRNFLIECGLTVCVRLVFNGKEKRISYKRMPANAATVNRYYTAILRPPTV